MLWVCGAWISLSFSFSFAYWSNLSHLLSSVLSPSSFLKRYLVSNVIMLAVSKFNKCEVCQQKITNILTIERRVVDSYFVHMSLIYWILI